MIGSFGEIIFEASYNKTKTFDEFNRTSADRWATHDIIGLKPKSEFLGPGLDKITFTMLFDVSLGVNPRTEMDKLLVMSRLGKIETLIVGGKPLGSYKWKILGLGQNWNIVDNHGNLIKGAINVTLEEYV